MNKKARYLFLFFSSILYASDTEDRYKTFCALRKIEVTADCIAHHAYEQREITLKRGCRDKPLPKTHQHGLYLVADWFPKTIISPWGEYELFLQGTHYLHSPSFVHTKLCKYLTLQFLKNSGENQKYVEFYKDDTVHSKEIEIAKKELDRYRNSDTRIFTRPPDYVSLYSIMAVDHQRLPLLRASPDTLENTRIAEWEGFMKRYEADQQQQEEIASYAMRLEKELADEPEELRPHKKILYNPRTWPVSWQRNKKKEFLYVAAVTGDIYSADIEYTYHSAEELKKFLEFQHSMHYPSGKPITLITVFKWNPENQNFNRLFSTSTLASFLKRFNAECR